MGDQVRMKRDIRRHFILTFFFIFVQKKRGEQKHALKGQIKIFKGCSFACIFFWLSFIDCKVSKIITLCAYAPWNSLDYNLGYWGYSFHFNLSVNQISVPQEFFHVSYPKWFAIYLNYTWLSIQMPILSMYICMYIGS